MSSSTFFTKNITFNGELSTDQSPLPGIGGILSSDTTGVFKIAVPPQPPSFVDGLILQTDIASVGGVKWDTPPSAPIWAYATGARRYFIPSNGLFTLIQDIGNNTFSGANQRFNAMYAGNNNSMVTPSVGGFQMAACTILGGGNNLISWNTGSPVGATIVGCDNCTLRGNFQFTGMYSSEDCDSSGQYSAYIAQGNLTGNGGNYSSCIGGRDNIINSGNGCNIIGSNCDISGGGNLLLGDNNLGAASTLSNTVSNSMSARFSNGYNFYSNSGLTSGSIMPAGGGWATISDENTKENLERLDDAICLNICEKLLSIDVCKYNYIGNPSEQVCYGPTAQDWHSEFGGELIDVPRIEEVTSEDGQVSEEFVLDEFGERIFDQVPAKDPRCIEMSDMLGILMASVKALNAKINVLIEADVEKDQQITALLEDANEKDEQINNLVEAINDIEVEQPEVYFTNNPLTQSFPPGSGSGVKVFEYVCQKSGKISLVSSTCFKKTSGSGGTIFVQLRLNNQLFSPSIQSGYEGEQSQYAPDLSGLTINWSGVVNQGDILTVYGLATSGTFSLVQSGQFSGATGAQLSITIY